MTGATKFVASFIGTPPMNFFAVRIEEADGQLFAVATGFKYLLPKELLGSIAAVS